MLHPDNAPRRPDIGSSWLEPLAQAFQAESFAQLKTFLLHEQASQVMFPKARDIFAAFNATPFDRVRVVILGQDPYHGPGQAHGLSFSVPAGIPPPPSLQNIFKEVQRDLGIAPPKNGDLTPWAEQGVLLLNSTLTVRASAAGSHQGKGWEPFTDEVIRTISAHRSGVVFLLWGRFAHQKVTLIDAERHSVLKAPHPSPLSAHRGFLGCGHFSKTNELLSAQGGLPINWSLP
ncbi:MAG: uracil-DNA glycosylase [Flavobacteriales bacterium]|nr:uracil-DNA glycosylase [Flavobacteriales bacterium]MBK7483631.1 uracil-DNA glycosylase [Flavobacteriales bacterium]MBK7621012.1 uracil-DNA glycosylase [Flavobacteriales bacterium]MBK8531663.1 uracil-DNA glycosylase [Flavobacteriales bacterium]MBK9628601.1 uracil-DNA glycosylase [Flavobacteriales bacterium]